MKKFIVVALCFLTCTLSACGGGGGGGSGSGSNSRGVRIIHGAIDAAPTDLTSSLDPLTVAGTASFGESSGYLKLPSGLQDLILTVRGDSTITVPATVSGSDKLSLLLFEENRRHVYQASLISNIIPDIGSDEVAVKVVHALRGVEGLAVTINSSASNVERAQASEYVVVPAGTVSILATSNGTRVYAGTLTLAGGSAYSVLLTGEVGYFVGVKLFGD